MESAGNVAECRASKLDVHLDLIGCAVQQKGAGIGIARFPDGGLGVIYREGVILVQNNYLDQVGHIVDGRERLDGSSDTPDALCAIDSELGPGIATPHHVLSVTSVLPCPATEPERAHCGCQPHRR